MTYYISPSGKDGNLGTIDSPWFTLNKAWGAVTAGDTIFIRGGTYSYGSNTNSLMGKSGTSGSLIKVWAYPGENPVFDYKGVSLVSQHMALRLNNMNYVHFKGFRIANMTQGSNWTHYGIILYNDVSNCIFEQIEVDHIGGTGWTLADRCNNNLFLNCDSHHNADPLSDTPYDMSDGFECGAHGSNLSTGNIFRGCRAWSNSDDGWDLRQADGVFTLDNCWSFSNGYIPGTNVAGGNGDGFKLGGKTSPGTNSILRTIKNSIAFNNRATGITPEPDASGNIFGLEVFNCISTQNAGGLGEGINTGNYNNYVKLRNNISFNNHGRTDFWNQGGGDSKNNSWELGGAKNTDFISVDPIGIDGPRKADGSLPDISFLHLTPTSKFINAGVDVGIPFNGNAPDLGPFEFNTAVIPPIEEPTLSELRDDIKSLIATVNVLGDKLNNLNTSIIKISNTLDTLKSGTITFP